MTRINACPHCGALSSDCGLKLDPQFRSVAFQGRVVILGRTQFAMLEALLQTYPRPAYNDWLYKHGGGGDRAARKSLTLLDRALRPLGFTIVSRRCADDGEGGFRVLSRMTPAGAPAAKAPAAARLACVG
jgi:hypothetical protein